MVLNNLFYITAKVSKSVTVFFSQILSLNIDFLKCISQFSDEHPKEMEELWATLCGCWPNNLKVIIRYLIIVSGMAPQELLPYVSKRFDLVRNRQSNKYLKDLKFLFLGETCGVVPGASAARSSR